MHLYEHDTEIDYEGETLYRGWRDKPSRLWQFNINPDDGNRLTPLLDKSEYGPASGMVLSAIQWSVNLICECSGAEELTKYYHAALGSHHKSTLIAAAQLQKVDNETSKDVEDFIESQNADVQYSAPGSHCPSAEKAVQTYKACFKSTVASLPDNFPIGYWCRLCE